MSLRKRQAINADGGNYRNYSKRGILWSTIDKNSVVAGTTAKATGQVTGLSFHTHELATYEGAAGNTATVWVSDPSNVAVTAAANPMSDDARNLADGTFSTTDTTTSVSAGASGLVFSTRCKLAVEKDLNAAGTAAGTDKSSKGKAMHFQYNIEKMGSGYAVGDYIVVEEEALGAASGSNNLVKVTVTSVSTQRS